jgi:hypothetical protein
MKLPQSTQQLVSYSLVKQASKSKKQAIRQARKQKLQEQFQ